jgi:hypothetical protein
VFDKAGNLYGATTGGGTNCAPIGGECGLVFELSPPAKQGDPWTESIVFTFKGEDENDASAPTGGLIIDGAGNLYGVTAYGGTGDCVLLGVKAGCGTVYELSPPATQGDPWTETLLYSFKSGSDGYFPWGTLTFDAHGNLYGATQFGGGKGNTCNEFYGGNCGTVFEMSPPKQKGGAWTEKVLYRFPGVANGKQSGDGANPNGGLVLDNKGAIYGTTYYGGNNQAGKCEGGSGGTGCGTVFALHPPSKKGGTWTEKVLYRFGGTSDGRTPAAGVVFDGSGSLYGTTLAAGPGRWGTIFRLRSPGKHRARWREDILYGFHGGDDGANPMASLTFDGQGYLYGTANTLGAYFSGTAFQLKPSTVHSGTWGFAVVHEFEGPPDGAAPAGPLVLDKAGSIYGTTQNGGTATGCQGGCGAVFQVSP